MSILSKVATVAKLIYYTSPINCDHLIGYLDLISTIIVIAPGTHTHTSMPKYDMHSFSKNNAYQ